MANANRKYQQVACYLDDRQRKSLYRLRERTRVPLQVFMREAVDDLLNKYKQCDSVDALMPPVRTRRTRRTKA